MTNRAAGGGLIRDCLGRCHGAFAANYGNCSITRAELKAAEFGLSMAWSLGFRKVHLCLDSSIAINIIKKKNDAANKHGLLTLEINRLLALDWDVQISHFF
ncbi:unnamed protein product [Linum trigynum]|uniref:RNase H type-1 domain-containing protein n=1 Tax=Linum trigynum TaxID=586398 RepID=A0AAV2DTB6_9ROSI